jgi:UDP-N-acetylmuramoylalanine--D-glutamate ligase
VANILAAACCAAAAGVGPEVIRQVATTFTSVEHRLEVVADVGGVRYVNDSKATNPDAALAALDAYPERVHLIAGGKAKGTPFDGLAAAAAGVVVRAYLVGEAAGEIGAAFDARGIVAERCGTIPVAVAAAAEQARQGDVVLLAPACTSFDQYANFEERGRDFRDAVAHLPGSGVPPS